MILKQDYIDTETRSERKRLKSREDSLTNRANTKPQALLDFLDDFMDVAKSEKPYIGFRDEDLSEKEKPNTYLVFEKQFANAKIEIEKRDTQFEAAENESGNLERDKDLPREFVNKALESLKNLERLKKAANDIESSDK